MKRPNLVRPSSNAHRPPTPVDRLKLIRGRRALFRGVTVTLALLFVAGIALGKPTKTEPGSILLVVMDPLSKELACACIKGYAQRDYRKLAAELKSAMKQPVSVEFSDDLADSLATVKPGREIIVIGDQGVVTSGAKKAALKCEPVYELTGQEGTTTLTGLFVARSDDPAKELKDLTGRTVLLGLADAGENRAVTLAALHAAGVEPGITLEKRTSYNEAALDVLDSQLSPPPVAVIPNYGLPLLEGCGSVKPGNFKVIGRTEPVPFIAVFVSENITGEKRSKLLKAFLKVNGSPKLLKTLESQKGFLPVKLPDAAAPKTGAENSWPDWRGPARDGHVPRLPERLPSQAKFVWKKGAMEGGLAGLSASGGRLIIAERDFADEHDLYRCLNATNGELLWTAAFPAKGTLDYGQFPRATPVIQAGKAYLLGAFGDLRCVNVTNGAVLWERALPREFKAPLPTWGMCSTPLVVDDLLIVNPGATNASLAALDCATGHTHWTTPGGPPAYSSFVCAEIAGRRQIVGYDQHSLGGWDVKTGERLWQLVPPKEGDFNVPTPIVFEGGIIVSTENNGTRRYRFDESGRIVPQPVAEYADLAPSTASPVATCGRVFGVSSGLRCLNAKEKLAAVWGREGEAMGDHATLIADDERVLVITLGGELILLDAKADTCAVLSRLRVFDEDVEIYSHPALVGTRLFVRGGSAVACVDLAMD